MPKEHFFIDIRPYNFEELSSFPSPESFDFPSPSLDKTPRLPLAPPSLLITARFGFAPFFIKSRTSSPEEKKNEINTVRKRKRTNYHFISTFQTQLYPATNALLENENTYLSASRILA
jgi:hypothetical protein